MATRGAQAGWVGSELDAGADAVSPAERGLCLSAMIGAAAGAFGGSALGADTAGVIPALCGMVGAVTGSTVAAAAWSAFAGLWHAGEHPAH